MLRYVAGKVAFCRPFLVLIKISSISLVNLNGVGGVGQKLTLSYRTTKEKLKLKNFGSV